MTASESGHAPVVQGSSGSASFMNATEDSEYEFEYDENETEDFYFTIDVSNGQSQGPNDQGTNKGNTSIEPKDKMQILDLHSDNPLIKYGNSFYSCHWSTDLGTQFYISHTGLTADPLRQGHVLDVVGISRAKLTGTPVTLHGRRLNTTKSNSGASADNAAALDRDQDGETTVIDYTPGGKPLSKNIARLTKLREKAREPTRKAQASFLEKLAIIKHKRGEKDNVPADGIDGLTGTKRKSPADALEDTSGLGGNKRVPSAYSASGINGAAATAPVSGLNTNSEMAAGALSNGDGPLQSQAPTQQAEHVNESTDAGATVVSQAATAMESGQPTEAGQGEVMNQQAATHSEAPG